MKNVCLIDLKLTGHHPAFLAAFAKTFLDLNCKVDLFVEDSARCKAELCNAIPELEIERLRFFESSAGSYKTRRFGCRSYQKLRRLNKEISAVETKLGTTYDLAFFAYLDEFNQRDVRLPYDLNKPFPRRFSGLLVSAKERVLESQAGKFEPMFTSFLKSHTNQYQSIGILTEDVQTQVEQSLAKEVVVYPDFSLNQTLNSEDSRVKQLRQKARGRKIVSLLGSISPHKSIKLFIACLKAADPDKYFFLIAGKIKQDKFSTELWGQIGPTLKSPPENMLVFDRWIDSETQFDSLVDASDLLFIFYRGFKNSSNILTKSAVFRTPAIVSDAHLIGERTRKYKLGFAVNETGAVELFRSGKSDRWEYDEALLEQFRKQHSASRLKEIFQRLFD